MAAFVSQVNHITGNIDWVMKNEDYDYHQEIARAAYADMLHDTERNHKYYEALKMTIKQYEKAGKEAHVLDIGTGTGLLSMMASRAGATSVTACEAFKPMADCAKKIMKCNKLDSKIQLVPKRSTEMTVGPDGDMKGRANILITEVFDTELIGEGAIGTFNDAHSRLLQDDCVVIPRAATMFVQPVCSEFVRRWNKVDMSHSGVKGTQIPCGGTPLLHDLQLDQLPMDQFSPISEPVKVFSFDFSTKKGIKKKEKSEMKLIAETEGRIDAIFMWWECEMDPKGEIILSCAPRWGHPDGSQLPWRDHWMQAIYYPTNQTTVRRGEEFTIICCHDEYSLWFDVNKEPPTNISLERQMCLCNIHNTISRSRIGMLGDPHRVDSFMSTLKKHISSSSVCLVIGDCSLLSMMAAKLTLKKVFICEPNLISRKITQSIIEDNGFEDTITILEKEPKLLTSTDFDDMKIDVVIGEPYFSTSLLPWHNICMWYAASDMSKHLASDANILPAKLCIKAIAMDFDHLWKIRAPVGICEGFDLAEFDKVIEASANVADTNVEPQPLWEYPGVALSLPVDLLELNYSTYKNKLINLSGKIQIERDGCLNGIALWAEFDFGGEQIESSGPRQTVVVGEKVSWDYYTQQGVHLIPVPYTVTEAYNVPFSVQFDPLTGEFDFTFTNIH